MSFKLSASRRHFHAPIPRHIAGRIEHVPGVSLSSSGRVSFSREIHTEESATVALRLAMGESIPVESRVQLAAVEATEDDLALIHERHSTVKDLSADEVVVVEVAACNDRPMRRPYQFTESALRKLAVDYAEGRTLLLGHMRWAPRYAIGRTFGAEVVQKTIRGIDARWLMVRAYMVTRNASAQRLQDITDVLTGQYSYASVGVSGGEAEYIEVSEKEYVWKIADNPDATARYRLDANELSFVDQGAVPGAGVSLSESESEDQEPNEAAPIQGGRGVTQWIM